MTTINLERLQTLDTDLFENRRNKALPDTGRLRERFRALIAAELARSASGPRHTDLLGVLGYLTTDQDHDSEGRDLSFNKRSFSRTELAVAGGLQPGAVVKYLLYRYRFNHYPRHNQLADFPIILAIEPTSVCNIRCVMCFQADKQLSGDKSQMGFMDFDLYRRVIDEAVSNDLCAIVLASRGEPTLHKDLFKMIEYAKRQGILDVKVNTNATRLTPERARAFLESGVDTLVFSVDAAVKEDFERIRVGAKFDTVVANIQAFNDIRASEYPDAKTRSRISMVVMDQRQEVGQALAFWEPMVDEFAYRWAIPRLHIYDQEPVPQDRPCSLLWERLYVWWDGAINPCDEDYLSRLSPGKLGDGVSIRDLWHSPLMQRYRERHVQAQKNDLHPCSRCPGL